MTNRSHRGLRGFGAFKRDVTLLTCILHLRCQPPTPFDTIADVLLETWPVGAKQLAEKVEGKRVEAAEQRAILSEHIESRFDWAEQECSISWETARKWNSQEVQEIIRLLKLDGYEVTDDREMTLQISWRRDEDWRAGSIPLGGPLKSYSLVADEGSPKSISQLVEGQCAQPQKHVSSEDPEPTISTFLNRRRVPHYCESFSQQLEEIGLIKNLWREKGLGGEVQCI